MYFLSFNHQVWFDFLSYAIELLKKFIKREDKFSKHAKPAKGNKWVTPSCGNKLLIKYSWRSLWITDLIFCKENTASIPNKIRRRLLLRHLQEIIPRQVGASYSRVMMFILIRLIHNHKYPPIFLASKRNCIWYCVKYMFVVTKRCCTLDIYKRGWYVFWRILKISKKKLKHKKLSTGRAITSTALRVPIYIIYFHRFITQFSLHIYKPKITHTKNQTLLKWNVHVFLRVTAII